MSNAQIIDDTSSPTEPPSGDGSITRYAFTLAIATAICLAIIAFMYILEQRTDETADRLDLPSRSAAQLYSEALAVEIPALRKRALSNFTAVYSNTDLAAQARDEIDRLSAEEDTAFAALSDTMFSLSASAEEKLAALDEFESQWGGGAYANDITAMRERLGTVEIEEETIAPVTRPARRLAGLDNQTTQDATDNLNELAGAQPSLTPAPVLLPETPEVRMPVIVEAFADDPATPRYPRRAQSRGIEALVVVSMDIDDTGKVVDARIVQPADGRYANDFGKAALAAARRTRFNPKTIDGEPAPTNGHVQRYRFALSD